MTPRKKSTRHLASFFFFFFRTKTVAFLRKSESLFRLFHSASCFFFFLFFLGLKLLLFYGKAKVYFVCFVLSFLFFSLVMTGPKYTAKQSQTLCDSGVDFVVRLHRMNRMGFAILVNGITANSFIIRRCQQVPLSPSAVHPPTVHARPPASPLPRHPPPKQMWCRRRLARSSWWRCLPSRRSSP